MKKDMPLEGLRWSRDSGSTLCDTPQNGRSRTGWGGSPLPGYVDILVSLLPLVICERNTIFKIITSDSIYDNRKNSEVIF